MMQSEDFEAEDTRGIVRLASRLSKFAVAGHPSYGAKTKIYKFAIKGLVSLVS
jgi:hypothetical protein